MKVNNQIASRERYRRRMAFFRRAFYRVTATYAEVKTVSSSDSCQVIYRILTTGAVAAPQFSPRMIYVTAGDFVADVELAAKGVLPYDEYLLFMRVFGSVDAPLVPEARYKNMAERVGKEFVRRRIYPLRAYLSPRVLHKRSRHETDRG